MGGFYVYNKYRKEANQLTLLFGIVALIVVLVTIFFPDINKKKQIPKDEVEKTLKDSSSVH